MLPSTRIVRLISVNAAEIHHDDAFDDYDDSDYRHGAARLAEEGDAHTDDRCCADDGPGAPIAVELRAPTDPGNNA